jgi:hypothetical protein
MPSRGQPRATALCLVLLAAAAADVAAGGPRDTPAPPAGAETIERVVAVIDDHPLLLSEVRALARVRGLAGEAAREAAIDERLMYAEASRVTQAEVSTAEETAAAAALVEGRPELGREVPRPDLLRLVHRQMAILRYIEFRFRPQVRVSDEDVRKAWEAEEVGRPSGLALEDAQEAIRARLERQALDQRIESWVGELRSRAAVRVVDPPPPAASAP